MNNSKKAIDGTEQPITACTYIPRWDFTDWIVLQKGQKFRLGLVSVSQWALRALSKHTIRAALLRHARGDWGEIDSAYADAPGPKPSVLNDQALAQGGDITSLYAANGQHFYVHTDGMALNTRLFMLVEQ